MLCLFIDKINIFIHFSFNVFLGLKSMDVAMVTPQCLYNLYVLPKYHNMFFFSLLLHQTELFITISGQINFFSFHAKLNDWWHSLLITNIGIFIACGKIEAFYDNNRDIKISKCLSKLHVRLPSYVGKICNCII